MQVIQRLKSLNINSEACYEFSYVKIEEQIDGIEPMCDVILSVYDKLV